MDAVFRSRRRLARGAAILGFVAGLRSQVPLAVLSISANLEEIDRPNTSPVDLLAKPAVAATLCLSAAGEAIVDKTPVVPSRLEAGPLGGRMFFGALAGSLLGRDHPGSMVARAALGAAAALGGSYAGYHARRYLSSSTGVPDVLWAGLEDAAAWGLGLLVTRRVA